ncbi:MAG TPA: HAD family phosphatase [Candidatus Limnocylindrales bacterium]|nr:HAD family phosphatase [Candidatus Limnocylindrales bacterium]
MGSVESAGTSAGMPIRVVVFDLDGVLVDSEPWWDAARVDFTARRGLRWGPDDQRAVMGPNSLGWARIMAERLGLDEPLEAIVDEVVGGVVGRYRSLPAPVIAPAVRAVRRMGADRPLAVASSSHRAVIGAALEAIGLGSAFAVVVSSDEVAHGKPAPDVYLETARRLGEDPAGCLVIEDSLNGVRAGRAAGMRVVLVPSALVPPADGAREAASLVLDSLDQLDAAAIAQLEAAG